MLWVLGAERTGGSEAQARPLAKCGQPPSPALEPRESLGAEPLLVGGPQDRESGSGFPAWSSPRCGECTGASEPKSGAISGECSVLEGKETNPGPSGVRRAGRDHPIYR